MRLAEVAVSREFLAAPSGWFLLCPDGIRARSSRTAATSPLVPAYAAG
jgi:hypothetical protein